MEILFLWFILGIIAIMVAATKGRNVFLWLFLGILFGPLALLYVALAEEK